MNDSPPDPIDPPEEFPALPDGELPDAEQLLPTEPSGPPAATNDPFGVLPTPASAPPDAPPPLAADVPPKS